VRSLQLVVVGIAVVLMAVDIAVVPAAVVLMAADIVLELVADDTVPELD